MTHLYMIENYICVLKAKDFIIINEYFQNDCNGEQTLWNEINAEPTDMDTSCADLVTLSVQDNVGPVMEEEYNAPGDCARSDEVPHNQADIEAQIETANRQKEKITNDLRKRKASSPIQELLQEESGVCKVGGSGDTFPDWTSTDHFKEEWKAEIDQNPNLDLSVALKHKDWLHYMHNPEKPEESRIRCRICHDYKNRFPSTNFLSEFANEG